MNREKIQFLIDNLQEGLSIEVKNWLGGISNNEERSRLAKEIIALANNGGGHIFIGFEDDEQHSEITPEAGEFEAFTQDNISNLIARYAEPACQCEVGFFQRTGSETSHPVIVVPGEHRTPVWARAASPDQNTLKLATVYVRRPGGNSEPARTQDDWEKLIDRLVKARQSEQLTAIRQIMNPQEETELLAGHSLSDWQEESYQTWLEELSQLDDDSPHRHTPGHWSFSFIIEPFPQPSLADLRQALDREAPSHSGWPPFTYIHRDPLRPRARGNVVQALLVEEGRDADRSDFWRVSTNGSGFLLRGMQEDRPGFMQTRSPQPIGPQFDWTLHLYRATELLKFVEFLGTRFSDEQAGFTAKIHYYNTTGRSLCEHNWRYLLPEGAVCVEAELTNEISGTIGELGTNMEEKVFQLMKPIYEQFDFTELPHNLVENVVREVLQTRF